MSKSADPQSINKRSKGVLLVIFFVSIATFASLIALGLDINLILGFAEINPQGGTLTWEMPGRISTFSIILCLLVYLLTIKENPEERNLKALLITVFSAAVVSGLAFFYDGEMRSKATNHIVANGFTLCEISRTGKGKYARDLLVFKLNCTKPMA